MTNPVREGRRRKTVYTLNIEGYEPRITALTYPLIKRWASRIGAQFEVIDSRKFPKWPLTYEKLQVYERSRKNGDEWSVFIDSDAIVHPDTPDFTDLIPFDTVAHNGVDMAAMRWTYDAYFRRDGRNIGSCTWLWFFSRWGRDLCRPLDDLTPEQAIANIQTTHAERLAGVEPEHLIDDYTLSRNIARFGLKLTTIREIQTKAGLEGAQFFWHEYMTPTEKKVIDLNELIDKWQLRGLVDG
jgi:hypothetical protein